MIMTTRQLIAALEDQALPDSPVFFRTPDGVPVAVAGGLVELLTGAADDVAIVLTPVSLSRSGGF